MVFEIRCVLCLVPNIYIYITESGFRKSSTAVSFEQDVGCRRAGLQACHRSRLAPCPKGLCTVVIAQ